MCRNMIVQYILVLVAAIQVVWGRYDCGREITVDADGNDTQSCLKGIYPCSSLGYVLNHLQSNDCVNMTSDSVPLTTIVELHNLNAIAIRGQGDTIVMCNNTGVVSCDNCSNVVIEGITWDRCGDPQKQGPDRWGGINFTLISNLFINNCFFQHSSVRALFVVDISGSIQILNTNFTDNANYETIFCAYSQYGFVQCTTASFTITGAVYIVSAISEAIVNILNCVFHHNGHFGRINDTSNRELPGPGLEIADGAGLLLVLPNPNYTVNISIVNNSFSSNCGRSGAGALISTRNSLIIKLADLVFYNNSVIKSYINASAIMVDLRTPMNSTTMPLLQMLSCEFYNNNGGRNMIGYIVGDDPAHVTIEQCNCSNNTNYDIGMIELNMQSHSPVRIYDANFYGNNGSALVYMQIHSRNIPVSIVNVTMTNNAGVAKRETGGLIIAEIFEDNCTIEITELHMTHNRLLGHGNGGGMYITGSFWSSFKCLIHSSEFTYNVGFGTGTAIYSSLECASNKQAYLMFIDECTFTHNQGNSIVYAAMQCFEVPGFLVLNGQFSNNTGSPLKLSNMILVSNDSITFQDNQADAGAALYLTNSYILMSYSSFQMDITNNFANLNGGGIFVEFLDPGQCHWLLYSQDDFCNASHVANDCETKLDTELFCNELPKPGHAVSTVKIMNNTALLSGSTIFYDDVYNIPPSRRSSDIEDVTSVFYIPEDFTLTPNASSGMSLATQPELVMLQEGAQCNDKFNACSVTGITLGQEISIPANTIGYNNKSAEPTRFLIECMDSCKHFSFPDDAVILINKKLRFSIVGDKVNEKATLPLKLRSEMITLDLTLDIFPCYLGYAYDETLHKCVCYDVSNIVSCTPTTTIKKGYWIGTVYEQTTTSQCPKKYCNFKRNEVSPGRFWLPAGYDDQCNTHRYGPACGKCEDGYTLSFDFDDCIETDNCTIGIILLVIVCMIIYWVFIIVVSLGLMYFKISIGYLYGIIYYYSVVHILLGQIMHYSNGLEVVEKILLSIVGLRPGFLSKLCFIQGMSGIDQYALHYIHPTAISLILMLLAICARHSRRFAKFISRGIIPTICLILTLTYTSIADTSLQLFQQLKYYGSDQIYCYLSPHIEYLTGQHIVYFIIAAFFEMIIVIGLSLLLLLEPFVNHRINFTCIKPLLDQFQGCYKDKYRWFAAVYLLCRQSILAILVIGISDQYIALYLLAVVCIAVALLHFLLCPYKDDKLNQYDGIVLQLLVLVVSLQIVSITELSGFNNATIVGMAYGLIFLPLGLYIILLVYIRRAYFIACLSSKCNSRSQWRDHDDTEMIPPPSPQEHHALLATGLRNQEFGG
ncbi:uncharacterized protein [Dysidea avara]|uniref:uncharacterized protein isoform X2 n=1 Tax=Dysidea avara TaxID=196820 RepID=UPI0033348CEF